MQKMEIPFWPGEPDTLVLAGGGNRCWWQAGILSTLLDEGNELPGELIATSAGAAIATAALTGGLTTALNACRALYARNAANFRWRGLLSLRMEFAHQHIYPTWLSAFVTQNNLQRLAEQSSKLLVAVTRPSRLLGLAGSVGMGTLAYAIDNKVRHKLHPRLPHWLGLRLEFLPIDGSQPIEDVHRLLKASAAPPPIMPAQLLGHHAAFDGGYTDNAPLPTGTRHTHSLTLLTRHYPKRPSIFFQNHRWYWQPSRPIPVSTWDCTYRATVDSAFALGQADAHAWLKSKKNGLRT
ncbi:MULTISPECIES: patatin-like phospholipase family protein [Hydrogenophaga]|uniref:Patatin-like phospholipase family protein n=2 Tax=Hydrogenophaga TaxID=47420 RepID=A0ABW2QS41_9BURK